MNQKLRFRNVDVSNVGRFDNEQSLCFSDGLTLIDVGNRGGGAIPIVEALHREYESTNGLAFQEGIGEFPSRLIFFEDFTTDGLYGAAPWEPLVGFMQTHPELSVKRSDLESELTKNVRKLLGAKIESRASKFSYGVASPEQLRVSLNDGGAICVTGYDGGDLSDCFHAKDERIVLYLSINAAVRKLQSWDVPFVVDSQLGRLDEWVIHSCYQFIPEMSKQVIIFEHYRERLGLRPSFLIVDDPSSGKSRIEKIT